jgi:hypothetical protein
MAETKKKQKASEPVFIIKPALKRGGLDYLHISLIALVLVLVALAFSLAYFKQGVVLENCQYGIVNGTCSAPKYNSTQALAAAERVLASYAYVNSSLSLLPYYSEVGLANVSFIQSENEWFIQIPYEDPLLNYKTFYVSMLLSGNNLTLVQPFLQTVKPVSYTNNSVVSLGVVNISGRVLCTTKTPIPVYLMVDPYAPGAMQSINNAINLSDSLRNSINMSYKIIFTNYSRSFYSGYGTGTTQDLGRYLLCTSSQKDFAGYVANLSKVFVGRPLDNLTLYQTAEGSGINLTMLSACMDNSTQTLQFQASLAQLYNIVSTPQYVVDCKYSAIPQTVGEAINYTLDSLNQSS